MTEKGNLSRQIEAALNILKFSMNYPINQPLAITDSLENLYQQLDAAILTEQLDFQNQPQHLVALKGIELNQLNEKRYKSTYYPSLSVFGSYQQSWQGEAFDRGLWFPTSLIGVRLNAPLFDGFLNKGRIQRAKLATELAQVQLEDLERGMSLDVQNSKTNLVNAQERLKNQSYALELADDVYSAAIIKYQEGVGSSIELTQAEQLLYDTQRNRIQAMYDVLTAQMALAKALGK